MVILSLKGGSSLFALLAMTACAAHHKVEQPTARFDATVPAYCQRGEVHLIDCNFNVNPPQCKHMYVSYDPKCVQIEVKK
jgi:hypothetical protein